MTDLIIYSPACSLENNTFLCQLSKRIHKAPDLQAILEAVASETQEFLAADRVTIYKLHADGSGQVIAESILANRFPALLGLNFPADDIPSHTRDLYLRLPVRVITDVDKGQIGMLQSSEGNECEWDRGDVTGEGKLDFVPLDPCHAEYLTNMGVKASIVAAIQQQEYLWGLLVIHYAMPQPITMDQVNGICLITEQLAIAITQATLLNRERERADRAATINRITNLLRTFPVAELQAALEETVIAFQGVGGRLAIVDRLASAENPEDSASPLLRLYSCGTQPAGASPRMAEIEQDLHWQAQFAKHQSAIDPTQPWAIQDLYEEDALQSLHAAFQETAIRSVLIIPLWTRQQLLGYLTVFRNEIDVETLWAGQFDPDARQTYPRQSFAAWRQTKSGQAQPWLMTELKLATELGNQFAAAIEQVALYQRVQLLNANLEDQVQLRTAQLHQAIEQQRLLFDVVTKMRQSLDLSEIFATVTREMRRILQADRVGVYQFMPNSNFEDGEVVAEEVLPVFRSALSTKVHDHCFGENYAAKYQQGQAYMLCDVEAAQLPDCYAALLRLFECKAILMMPLRCGSTLWGLFFIHQCSQPRQWHPTDVQFVTQIAEQMGIALEQVELLQQTQQQAQQLSQTVEHLQHTQLQLIQTEKMSSLGRLVAGIAHEINNPVNFIAGNLNHIGQYTQDLLSVLALYQQQLPEPDEELRYRITELDIPFLEQDLPKILASMKVGADRIRQIVLSLRTFSRLDEAEKKWVDLHEGIDSALLILQHRLKSQTNQPEIEIVKFYGDIPLVECYPGQLNQVFMNLLTNAIESLEDLRTKSRSNGSNAQLPTIKIQTETAKTDWVRIRISDNGIGISENYQAQIFDPFFTTKPIGKGTGLGLPISYQIVTGQHRGKLSCISQLNQGAEFIIDIPIRQSLHR